MQIHSPFAGSVSLSSHFRRTTYLIFCMRFLYRFIYWLHAHPQSILWVVSWHTPQHSILLTILRYNNIDSISLGWSLCNRTGSSVDPVPLRTYVPPTTYRALLFGYCFIYFSFAFQFILLIFLLLLLTFSVSDVGSLYSLSSNLFWLATMQSSVKFIWFISSICEVLRQFLSLKLIIISGF